MNNVFEALEEKVLNLLRKLEELRSEVQKCDEERRRLETENADLRAMLKSQSVRVEALVKKLEEALKNSKNERGVRDEKNGDF